MEDLEFLDRAVTDGTAEEELIGILRGMIPNYRAPEEVNRSVMAERENTAED